MQRVEDYSTGVLKDTDKIPGVTLIVSRSTLHDQGRMIDACLAIIPIFGIPNDAPCSDHGLHCDTTTTQCSSQPESGLLVHLDNLLPRPPVILTSVFSTCPLYVQSSGRMNESFQSSIQEENPGTRTHLIDYHWPQQKL
jgi:hypothetical protein